MLILIDSSVTAANLAEDHDSCHGIHELFAAAYRGEHFVLADRNTLDHLIANASLSAATRSIAAKIRSSLPTLGAIAKQVQRRVNVINTDENKYRRTSSDLWVVPLKMIGARGIRKAIILTENLDDATAYEHAAKQYKASEKMAGQISLEIAGGGGSTIPEAFGNYTNVERRWCLCITDSDRICPDDNMDVSAQRCCDIADLDDIVASHVDIKSREIENILPLKFLEDCIPASHQDKWEWHVQKLLKIRQDAHRYCDIKKGITFRKVNSYLSGTPRRDYWSKVMQDLRHASAISIECSDNECAAMTSQEPCNCNVTYGFGTNILASVISKLTSQSAHESERQIRNDVNRQEWLNLGRIVYEWGCAPSKTRI